MKTTLKLLASIKEAIGSTWLAKTKSQMGFTMIELLIVIAILGILAVAVLSAINPIEQINRGRDTGSRSDAEQLLSAMDRYNAFNGYYPFQETPTTIFDLPWTTVLDTTWSVRSGPACLVFDRLGSAEASVGGCVNADELKEAFVTRVSETDYNPLFVWNRGTAGDSTYVCFLAKSGAFKTEANDRCDDTSGTGLPADLQGATSVCGDSTAPYICLP